MLDSDDDGASGTVVLSLVRPLSAKDELGRRCWQGWYVNIRGRDGYCRRFDVEMLLANREAKI